MYDAPPTDPFAALVTEALRLPLQDQRRLADLLRRVVGPEEAHPDQAAPVDEPSIAGEDFDRWLASLGDLPAWQQLLLIDDAADKLVPGNPSQQKVDAARARLLNEQPAVTVRLAVQRMAAEHPWKVCAGIGGMLFAVAALARGLFRLMF